MTHFSCKMGKAYLKGELSPVFFGSAINNFGVKELLDCFIQIAPTPLPRQTEERPIGLLIVGIGRVPLNAQDHRRHAKGDRNLARGSFLGLLELHVGR